MLSTPVRTQHSRQYIGNTNGNCTSKGVLPALSRCAPHAVAAYPLRPLPCTGCDLHGDSESIRIGRRVPLTGGVFNQTDVAWNKGVRGAIGEPDDRPSYETHLPAPEGSRMQIQEVPWGSFLHAET